MNKPMKRRGLTLLETLIALVLVLALGALIFPALMNSLDERSFESAADVTNEQLMMARAHAQATGSPVEVTYNANTAQVQVRLFAPWLTKLQASPMQATGTGHETAEMGPLAPPDDKRMSDAAPLIEEAWACRDLGHGLRMSSHPPASTDSSMSASGTDEASDDDRQSWNDLAKGQDIRLAVFMPDGSALLGDPVWLNDDKGRCGMLSVNPWSGMPFFQRLADGGDQHVATSGTQKSAGGDEIADERSTTGSRKATASADQNRRGRPRNAPRSSSAEPDEDTVGSQ